MGGVGEDEMGSWWSGGGWEEGVGMVGKGVRRE